MKTPVLNQPGWFATNELPEPASLLLNEALVQIYRVGACGNDLHAHRGHQPFFSYPRILRHELGVEVLAIGSEVFNVRVS